MTLLSVVQKQVPSATQPIIDRILGNLNKTEVQILKDKLAHVVVDRVRVAMASGDITPGSSAMKSAVPTENIPNTPAMQQAVQHQSKPQALNVQAQSAATQSMNFAPTILVAAAERMNHTLAAEQEALTDKIANLGIASARKQMDNLIEWAEVAFANPFMQGILDNTLAEWSGETIETPALMPGQN
jgi:hypothetical protein